MYSSMRLFEKYVILLLILFSNGRVCNAQNLEQVHLKDGSVIEGFICEQIPGKSVTVQGCKATMFVGADSLISSSESIVSVGSLSTEWKSWLMEQNVTPDAVRLSTLKFPNTEYADVRILENGGVIKFLSLSPEQYHVDWNDILKTVKVARPVGQFSGLNDVLIMKDGSKHVGQVSVQIPGKNIKINLSKDNAITVNSAQIVEMQSVPASDQLSIIEQSPLLDRIYIKGSSNAIDGVIVKRRTSRDLTIHTRNDGDLTYAIRDITKFQKVPNADYKVLTDRNLNKGEILLNGDTKNAWFAPLETINGYLVLGENVSMVANKGEELVLEANLENPSAAINVIKAYRKDISGENDKKQLVRDVFTYQDLVELALPVTRTATPLGNTKVTFKLETAGDYVLSVQGQRGFIIIHVD